MKLTRRGPDFSLPGSALPTEVVGMPMKSAWHNRRW